PRLRRNSQLPIKNNDPKGRLQQLSVETKTEPTPELAENNKCKLQSRGEGGQQTKRQKLLERENQRLPARIRGRVSLDSRKSNQGKKASEVGVFKTRNHREI
ncbi:hypothetical protein C922_01743, partial [Plasmodium inui San Antonio 1]